MSYLLGCENLNIEYGVGLILDGVTLGVNEGDRIGIVGENGGGKSTLLNLLGKRIEPDSGSVTHNRGLNIGYLAQNDSLDDLATVEAAVFENRPKFEWASDARIRSIVDGLLYDVPFDSAICTLSGGQRRRVDLARVLVGEHDVLMLDEPTNHLDIEGIAWLANYLQHCWRKGEGALLVVTHDRWFLDEVATSMWEVHDAKVEPFEGGYSAYILQRVERAQAAETAERKRKNLARRELAWLSRGARARATKPKFHLEQARALIADVPPLRNPLELKRTAMSRLGKQVVSLRDVSVSFDGEQVLNSVRWNIGPGDRIGILGENGAGKTTLLNVIQGKLTPTKGSVKIGQTVRFAILSQRLEELEELNDERVRDVVKRYKQYVLIDGKETTPSQLLEHLGFSNAHLSSYVKDLSGGQRRRLQLMLILLDKPNVLILDEPGNDLDTDMLAAVEGLLDGWPGTLFIVTHDRFLMEHVADELYELADGNIRHLPGGVDEYLERCSARKARKLANTSSTQASQESAKPSTQLSQKELYELKKERTATDRKLSTLRGKVAKEETTLHSADPTNYVELGDIQKRINTLKAQITELEDRWLEISEVLDD